MISRLFKPAISLPMPIFLRITIRVEKIFTRMRTTWGITLMASSEP